MSWRQREKIEQCTCEQVRPNASRRAWGIFKPQIESITTSSLAALNNKERKAVEVHQLKVERKRAEAIIQARYSICR